MTIKTNRRFPSHPGVSSDTTCQVIVTRDSLGHIGAGGLGEAKRKKRFLPQNIGLKEKPRAKKHKAVEISRKETTTLEKKGCSDVAIEKNP